MKTGISEGVIFQKYHYPQQGNNFRQIAFYHANILWCSTLTLCCIIRLKPQYSDVFSLSLTKNINFSRFALSPYIMGNSGDLLTSIFMPHLPSGVASDSQYVRVEKSDYFHWVMYRHKQITGIFLLHGN
ncbi:hypothetical protein [Escherichia coli]|uniref:hypothetical protein n=1 Tax=Escherichia coli TaxID=562 RepID=UPI00259FC76A|nr:hypothetical protein [Escherichia coli]